MGARQIDKARAAPFAQRAKQIGQIATACTVLGVLAGCVDDTGSAKDRRTEQFVVAAQAGDIYACNNPENPPLYFRVGQVDRPPGGEPVYGIQIIPAAEGLPRMAHAAFLADSFAFCVPDPLAPTRTNLVFDDAAFIAGYREWRVQGGGVFTFDVTELPRLTAEAMVAASLNTP